MKDQMIAFVLLLMMIRVSDLLRLLQQVGWDGDIMKAFANMSLDQIERAQRYAYDIRSLTLLFSLVLVTPL